MINTQPRTSSLRSDPVRCAARTTVLVGFLIVAFCNPLLAQVGMQTVAGDHVRVTTPSGRVTGVLLAVDQRSLTIRPAGAAADVTILRARTTRFERLADRRSRWRYTGLGALTGLGAGALGGLASAMGCKPNEWFCSPGANAVAGGILGAGIGAVAGALVPPAEEWVGIDVGALSDIQYVTLASAFQRNRRLSVSVGSGTAWGGPAGDLEAAMRLAGFDQTTGGFFGAPTPHPHSNHELGSVWFAIPFQVNPAWEVSIAYSRTKIGQTFGYRAPSQYLFVSYEAGLVGGMVSRSFGPLRLGAGPAWYSARWSDDASGITSPNHSRIGIVTQAGVKVPAHTRAYLDLNLQYRYTGRTPVGPFTPGGGFGTVPFPETAVRVSHWFIGLGPGLRF
jgi:hypothetical protein